MKKFFQFSLLLSLTLLATACSDAVRPFVGDYSYKISGKVTVDGKTKVLSTEQGSLQLVRKDKSTVLMTFNELGGDIYTATGHISDSQISFTDAKRTLQIAYTGESTVAAVQYFDLTVTGEGEIQNETIVFNLTYSGEGLNDGTTLTGNDIVMVAKQN